MFDCFYLTFYLSDVCLFDKLIFIAFYCVFYIVIPTFVFPSLNSFRGGEGLCFITFGFFPCAFVCL